MHQPICQHQPVKEFPCRTRDSTSYRHRARMSWTLHPPMLPTARVRQRLHKKEVVHPPLRVDSPSFSNENRRVKPFHPPCTDGRCELDLGSGSRVLIASSTSLVSFGSMLVKPILPQRLRPFLTWVEYKLIPVASALP